MKDTFQKQHAEDGVPEDEEREEEAAEEVAEGGPYTGEAWEGRAASAAEKLKKELARCRDERKLYLDGWQRAQADYANLSAGLSKEKERMQVVATERFVHELLPIMDSFDLAFRDKKKWEAAPPEWRQGIENIHSQLTKVFEKNEAVLFDDEGQTFDPVRHHAAGHVPVTSETEIDTVKAVIQRGCEINGRVVRPALVKLGEIQKSA